MARTDLGDVTLHFVVNRLALNRGGLVKAVRLRAGELVETGLFAGVVIEVLGNQPRLGATTRRLQREGHLHRDVQAREILSLLDTSPPNLRRPRYEPAGEVVEAGDGTSLVMESGRPVQRIRYRGRKPALITDLDDSGTPVRRRLLSPAGAVLRIEEHDESGQRSLQWVGRDDQPFLDFAVTDGVWSTPDGPVGEVYRRAFEAAFAGDTRSVVVSEFRDRLNNLPDWNLDQIIAACRTPGVGKVAFLHSNHRTVPYGRDAPVHPTWKPLLLDIADAYDAIGVWTPAQKADLEVLIPHEVPIVVTPPSAPLPAEPVATDPDRFIAVARIAPKKGIEELLGAFARVREARPTARLEIFGFRYATTYDQKIAALIDELELTDCVVNARFVKNVDEAYRGAVAMLMTSRSEGFGLALLESCAFGVPPIAFDVDYGPRDVIVDGVNGFLVLDGDAETFADRAVGLAADPALRRHMGAAARTTGDRFPRETSVAAWLDLVDTALAPHRSPTASLTRRVRRRLGVPRRRRPTARSDS